MRSWYLFFILIFVILLLPTGIVRAEGVQFVSQSVFLSQPSAPAGTPVLIYASLVNTSTSTAFNGVAVFQDGSAELGRVGVVLSPGEARVVSISWTPGVGSHSINAVLENTSGGQVAAPVEGSTQAEAVFTIEAPPPPPPPEPTPEIESQSNVPGQHGGGSGDTSPTPVIRATEIAESIISTLPPAASSTVAAIFSTVDKARDAIVDVLDTQIASARKVATKTPTISTATKMKSVGSSGLKQPASSTPSVLLPDTASSTVSGTASDIFSSLYLDLLLFLRFLLASATLSYLCILAIIFFLFYLLYCRLAGR